MACITGSVKRVFIADPSFQDWMGHHAPYDLAVADGLKKAGVETIILANKALKIGDELQGICMERIFSHTAWGVKTVEHQVKRPLRHFLLSFKFPFYLISFLPTPYVFYKRLSSGSLVRQLAHIIRFVVSLLRILVRKLIPPIITDFLRIIKLTATEIPIPHVVVWLLLYFSSNRHNLFSDYYALMEFLEKQNFGPGDILFSHMVTGNSLPLWSLVASRLARVRNSGKLVILFRYPKCFLGLEKKSNRLLFRAFEQAFSAGKMRGATDSALLTKEYAEFLLLPLPVFPIPHIPSLFIDKNYCPRKCPLRCVSLGNARDEKGIAEIFDAIRMLNAKGHSANFQFRLQVHCPDAASAPHVERMVKENLANVTLHTEPLIPSDYDELLSWADVVLVPYWSDVYASRTSGIMIEAMAASKIVVTTHGTWMEHEGRKFNAGAEYICDKDPHSLASALLKISMDSGFYFSKAALAAQSMRRFHNSDTFAEMLLYGSPRVPIKQGDTILICYPWGNFFLKAGSSRRVSDLCRMLSEFGYKLELFIPDSTKNYSNNGMFTNIFYYENNTKKTIYYFMNHFIDFICTLTEQKILPYISLFRDRVHDKDFSLRALRAMLGCKAVIVEYPFYMKQIAPLAKSLGMPVLETCHDYYTPMYHDTLWHKLINTYEISSILLADIVFTVAKNEHDILLSKNIVNILAPNGTDLLSFKDKIPQREQALSLLHRKTEVKSDQFCLFVGSSADFNIKSVNKIKTMAIVSRDAGFSTHFVVAGDCAAPYESTANFLALGVVDDDMLLALYAACRLVVLPLPYGTGSSIKTVEAMGLGKVTFGTSVAFRGLAVTDGMECFIEDDLDNYPSRIDALLQPENAELLQNVAEKAAHFGANYDYRQCLKPYVDVLRKEWGNEK
jgi:glycosyltransferase involved in cell wall biosynthesis